MDTLKGQRNHKELPIFHKMPRFTRWQTIGLVVAASTAAAVTSFLAAHLYFKSSLVGDKFDSSSKKRKSIGGSNSFSHEPDISAQTSEAGKTFVPPLPEPVVLLLK